MSGEYQVQIDAADVKAKLHKLEGIRNGAPRAMMRSFNKTVTGMKTDAAREISQRYTAKQKDVKDKLETHKATMSNLSVALQSRGRPMRSIKFQHGANTQPGVKGGRSASLRVMKAGQRQYLSGDKTHSKAFIATMSNGAQGIFQRTGDIVGRADSRGNITRARIGNGSSKYAKRKARQNIEQVRSPGVVQMLDNPIVRRIIPQKATERFNKAIDHEIDYLLKK